MRGIRRGSIFFLDDCPPLEGGVEKKRPVVVISANKYIDTGGDVIVAACSSTAYESDKSRIQLPDRTRTPQTKSGLSKTTWLVPRWFLPIEQNRLTAQCGHLTGDTLKKVVQAVEGAIRSRAAR